MNNKDESRSIKSVRNVVFNIANQIIAILLQFILRTVFIKTLSIEYLGVNGLFSNILTMLSLTELGFGTAIICSMYTPLEKGDIEEIKKYFFLFKKIYYFIGAVILLVGVGITPFINFFIADSEKISGIRVLFILYLLDTVASYFFAQYRALFTADQKDYINANNRTLFLILQSMAQILALFVTHSFILYLIIKITCNLLSGFFLSIKARKAYPFITNIGYYSLSKTEKNTVFKDTFGVFSTKIELMVLNSTDNILLSSFFGSVFTGLYSNYNMIVGTLSTTTGLVFTALQSSIGSFCNSSNVEQMEQMYRNITYLYYCIYSFGTICLTGLLSPFISIWLGDDYIMPLFLPCIISFNYFLSNSRQVTLQFLTVNHMIKYLNIKNLVEACMNILISLFLVIKIGYMGIFIGTSVSLLVTSIWYEPYVLYKHLFKQTVKKYYFQFVLRTVISALGVIIAVLINKVVFEKTVLSFVVCVILNVCLAAVFSLIPYYRTEEFRYFTGVIKHIIYTKLNK